MFGLCRAPELHRAGTVWLNTDGTSPPSLSALRGKIVILDFWTYCCINCMHVLPTLRRIETQFGDTVAVIGVHSPKFDAERDIENVKSAIERYDIRHPVLHDPNRLLWRDYAVKAWPTLVLISPDGAVMGQVRGEPDPDRLLEGIREMIQEFSRQSILRPLSSLPAEKAPSATSPASRPSLRFPGKIKPLRTPWHGAHWAVADSGNHQIVLFTDEGQECARYGSGQQGFQDGPPEQASFSSPQGFDSTEEALIVADTGNHALRKIDLETGAVSTLIGTGERGLILNRPSDATQCVLASPWDVAVDWHRKRIFFANAGTHQIGVYDPATKTVAPVAGTGGENIVDGPALSAFLAQPSGLVYDAEEDVLYFTDSETSSIRMLRLAGEGSVETLVGSDLFSFGPQDGDFTTARLQHPLGLCFDPRGGLLVADSYNQSVRHLSLDRREVCTLPPFQDSCGVALHLSEPAGLWAASNERLLISDTNHHRIVELLLEQGLSRVWNQRDSDDLFQH